MFKRRVRIFGRSISLATLLLAVVVLSAAAWGLYMLFATDATAYISVKEAPRQPDVSFPVHVCGLDGGSSGAAEAIWDPEARTLTCLFTDFDEASLMKMRMDILSNETEKSLSIGLTSPATTPCVFFEFLSPPAAIILPGVTESYILQVQGVDGLEGTVTCGGEDLGPFVMEFVIEIIP